MNNELYNRFKSFDAHIVYVRHFALEREKLRK